MTTVLELRNYLLRPGRTRDFIRYFEEHFLFSQRDAGMEVLGQFAVEGEPDRFAWIRGFADLTVRGRALEAFYGGGFWLARRDEANAMMLEHHNVHLLRPLGPLKALAGGATLEDRSAEPAGALPPEAGVVVADFYHAVPGALGSLVACFERHVQPALADAGHEMLGHFVAELAPNDYPRLPVIQDPTLLVVLFAYRDREQCTALRAGWRGASPPAPAPMGPLLAGDVTTLHLRPTARSLARYRH
jgi:NIPSNAP